MEKQELGKQLDHLKWEAESAVCTKHKHEMHRVVRLVSMFREKGNNILSSLFFIINDLMLTHICDLI